LDEEVDEEIGSKIGRILLVPSFYMVWLLGMAKPERFLIENPKKQ
jgi:hypothetical protein